MYRFPPFPCCKNKNISKKNVINSHLVFQITFGKIVNLINANIKIPFIEYSNMNEKEKNMENQLIEMSKYYIETRNEHLHEFIFQLFKDIKKIEDVCPILERYLKNGLIYRISKGEPLYARKKVLYNIFPMPYQDLVIETLIYTAYYAVQSIQEFKRNRKLYKDIQDLLIRFYDEQNITDWIEHVGRSMDPFGKNVPCEIKNIINQLLSTCK